MNRHRGTVCLLLFIAAVVFGLGINWGLPTRQSDRYLIGPDGHGLRLEPLTSRVPEVDASHGADVVDPSGPSDQPTSLNRTDADAAKILCRYRLYSFQPDEMITFRSLSAMKPSKGDFDPRLYQYGGLWIYPVGAILEFAGHVGLLQLTDRSLYIADPELFGKFYIAARAYSAAWGLVAVWAVFVLTRRLTGPSLFASAMAALAFIFMPVVIDMAHEAKPHLAGTALILLAILAADNYTKNKSSKWLWITGALCGAAAGMVLWAAISLAVLVALACLSPGRRLRIFLRGAFAALIIYCISNPYVPIHLFRDPAALRGNLGNTSAMYSFGRPDLALLNGIELLALGTGPALLIVGLIAHAKLFRNQTALQRILLITAAAMLIPFFLFAAGKPAEYARFALVPDTALLIAALVWCERRHLQSLAILVVTATAVYGVSYVAGFIHDSGKYQDTTRAQVAATLEHWLTDWNAHGADPANADAKHSLRPAILVYLDPAPFSLPPVDLDGWNIVRLPKGFQAPFGLIVTPYEQGFSLDPEKTPISWANKGFQITNRLRQGTH